MKPVPGSWEIYGSEGRNYLVVVQAAAEHYATLNAYYGQVSDAWDEFVYELREDGTIPLTCNPLTINPDLHPTVTLNLKWDGCCNVALPHGGMHTCDEQAYEEFLQVLRELRELAGEMLQLKGDEK